MFYESTATFFEADLRDTESSIGNVIYYSLYYVIGIYLKNLTDQGNVKSEYLKVLQISQNTVASL